MTLLRNDSLTLSLHLLYKNIARNYNMLSHQKCQAKFENRIKLRKIVIHVPIHDPFVDQRAAEKNVHAKVQPDHHDHNARETPIHRKTSEIINVDRKTKGIECPENRRDHCSRIMFFP